MKKYTITFLVDLMLTALIAWWRGILTQTAAVDIFHVLCDCFFVVGIVTSGIGSLIFVSNEGAFDGLTYAVRAFTNLFRAPRNRDLPSYYDYRMTKAEKKMDFAHILICGLVFLAISGVMFAFYCKYHG